MFTRDEFLDNHSAASRATAAVDGDNNIIYIWFPPNEVARIKLLRSHDYGVITGVSKQLPFPYAFFGASKVVFVNKLHLIGGNNHYVYDADAAAKWNCRSRNIFREAVVGHAMVKIKDKLLTFGGTQAFKVHRNTILHTLSNTDAVNEYDIIRGHWTKSSLRICAFYGSACTPILNGKYILFICGDSNQLNSSSNIRIYSVTDQTMRKSNVKCLESLDMCDAVSVRNERNDVFAVSGYVRREWKECGIVDHLFHPEHILNLMAAWYWSEFVHICCADRGAKGQHHKIDALDIISLSTHPKKCYRSV